MFIYFTIILFFDLKQNNYLKNISLLKTVYSDLLSGFSTIDSSCYFDGSNIRATLLYLSTVDFVSPVKSEITKKQTNNKYFRKNPNKIGLVSKRTLLITL